MFQALKSRLVGGVIVAFGPYFTGDYGFRYFCPPICPPHLECASRRHCLAPSADAEYLCRHCPPMRHAQPHSGKMQAMQRARTQGTAANAYINLGWQG